MKYDTKALEAKMKKTISAYETNLETIRAGQANPAVLNRVTFEYYGAPTPLNTIQPYDRSTLKAMEKAILASDVGITPLNDGTVLRLVFPQLTEERRRDLTKQVKKMGEDAKVALRNERRNANEEVKKAKKDSTMTEDEATASEKLIQDVTDKFVKNVDAITDAKNKELMEI